MSVDDIKMLGQLFVIGLVPDIDQLGLGLFHGLHERLCLGHNLFGRDTALDNRHPVTVDQVTAGYGNPGGRSDSDENRIFSYVNLHRSHH